MNRSPAGSFILKTQNQIKHLWCYIITKQRAYWRKIQNLRYADFYFFAFSTRLYKFFHFRSFKEVHCITAYTKTSSAFLFGFQCHFWNLVVIRNICAYKLFFNFRSQLVNEKKKKKSPKMYFYPYSDNQLTLGFPAKWCKISKRNWKFFF